MKTELLSGSHLQCNQNNLSANVLVFYCSHVHAQSSFRCWCSRNISNTHKETFHNEIMKKFLPKKFTHKNLSAEWRGSLDKLKTLLLLLDVFMSSQKCENKWKSSMKHLVYYLEIFSNIAFSHSLSDWILKIHEHCWSVGSWCNYF